MNSEFNLERATAGEPIETVTGNPVEFIAYRPTAEACKQLIVQVGTDILMYYANGRYPSRTTKCYFNLRMKLVAKQIDWSKMPIDTLITIGIHIGKGNRYFDSFSSGVVHYFRDGMTSKTADYKSDTFTISLSEVQIAPDQPWTVWLGGECPLPDGLEFEYITHAYPGEVRVSEKSPGDYSWSLNTVYAYRLTGKVLEGYKL
jgi:hypothetical protein